MTATTSENTPAKVPPHIKEWPLLGSLPGMLKDPMQHFLQNYRKYGPVYEMTIMGRKYKVLCGKDAASFMSSREGREALTSKDFWDGLHQEWGATNSLPYLDGKAHDDLRQILRHGYSRESIKGRYNDLAAITDEAIDREWKPGTSVPVLESFQFMIADQLGIMITGSAPREYVADIRMTILYILNCLITKQRPKFMMLSPRYKKAKQRVLELGQKMKEDWQNRTEEPENKTLVDHIMEASRDQPNVIPESNLLLQLTAPYVAGLDTVANTLAASVYAILKHPEVKRRVTEEVDAYFDSDEPIVEKGFLKKFPITNAAILETMRMYPIAVALGRSAAEDFEIAGYQINKGDLLYMANPTSHYQEEYFPDPYKFDLDRHLAPRHEFKQPGVFSPFGRGPHTCLGKTLAEIQLVITIARLFYNLDMELPSPNYELKTKTAPTPGPSMSFNIKVKGRRH